MLCNFRGSSPRAAGTLALRRCGWKIEASRARGRRGSTLLAALCPFTANYAAGAAHRSLATFSRPLADSDFSFSGPFLRIDLVQSESDISARQRSWLMVAELSLGLETLVRLEVVAISCCCVAYLVGFVYDRPENWKNSRSQA